MDLLCLLVSLLAPVCKHLAKDISHSAIYRSSETFPFQLKGFVTQRLWRVCMCVCVSVCVCVCACVCKCMAGCEQEI